MVTNRHINLAVIAAFTLSISACGASSGADSDAAVSTSPDTMEPCIPSAEVATCSDGIDNDCDGITNCTDPDCSGTGGCAVCGTVQRPNGPLALPDGTCDSPATNCTPLESTIATSVFAVNQRMTKESDLQYVCAKMEHSWLRDLNIELIAPNGFAVQLQTYDKRRCNFAPDPSPANCKVTLGMPVVSDDTAPTPGVGYLYCWDMTTTNPPLLQYANQHPMIGNLPAEKYRPSTPFSGLIGTALNGNWKLRVTDIWHLDNGYVFDWTIAFDPNILQVCPSPIGGD